MDLSSKWKEFTKSQYMVFFSVVILFWLKTYIVYRIEFNLGVENGLQEFLLFINPISSAMFFLGIALFFKGRKRYWAFLVIDALMSLLLYANVCYYRFFDDFITLPVLFQTGNFGELGDSALGLMKGTDVFYFLDTFILIGLLVFRKIRNVQPQKKMSRYGIGGVFAAAILVFAVNLGLAESDRPGLLTRTFDRNYLVKYLGAYNYSIYDVVQSTKSSAQRALASSNDLVDVENFTKGNHTKPSEKYFGKAEDMNVLYVSMESLQNFIIDYKINGQEVTPFLNKLAHGDSTFYFDNFFHQVGQGKTSDAEFMMANSLYPLPQGAVFTQKSQNTYQAAPQILKSRGYTSASFHGNNKSFWNRDQMYQALGYDKFFDESYFDMSDENTINYGLKDKPFFKQSMPYLKNLQEPFLAKFLSLSNHFPYVLDKGDTDFPEGDFGDGVVNRYFKTAHYMDTALKQFFNKLKSSGLYDNTVIVMYGDHYGISTNHNAAMSKVTGDKITPYKNAQLQRVPLFIHVPGVKGKTIHKYGGEIDVRPTILHLLGINTKDYISFGSDLLSPDHNEVVPFRNGDFVTPEYTQVSGKCYRNPDGKKVDKSKCKPSAQFVRKELNYSDKVVYGDLLRFNEPDGFEPVNRDKINYNEPQTDITTPFMDDDIRKQIKNPESNNDDANSDDTDKETDNKQKNDDTDNKTDSSGDNPMDHRDQMNHRDQ